MNVRWQSDLLIKMKAYFLFVITLITRTIERYRKGRVLKFWGTMHYPHNHTSSHWFLLLSIVLVLIDIKFCIQSTVLILIRIPTCVHEKRALIFNNINWSEVQKECCKQCRHVKYKGTMTKWPVQKTTHRTTQKHVETQDATDI